MQQGYLQPLEGDSSPPEAVYGPWTRHSNNECLCLKCARIGTSQLYLDPSRGFISIQCRYPGCKTRYIFFPYRGSHQDREGHLHERSHYEALGNYHCREDHCSAKAKSWNDLIRHTKSTHCKRSTKIPCPYAWCKRGGDNGFPRKDKLTSHIRNVHEGKMLTGEAGRSIKPAAQDEAGAGYKA